MIDIRVQFLVLIWLTWNPKTPDIQKKESTIYRRFFHGLQGKGNSMILTFHVPPLASGQRLCYIDRVKLGVPQKNFEKLRVLMRQS